MLENALLWEDQIRKSFYKIWYDPKYEYYFGGMGRWQFQLNDTGFRYAFASVKHTPDGDQLIGYINYEITPSLGLATNFGAINFSNDKLTFACDLKQAVKDIFCKYGMETMEFAVICGNPVEKSYDRMVQKMGGRILCTRHNRAKTLSGEFCDDKLYEITKENFFSSLSNENKPLIRGCP